MTDCQFWCLFTYTILAGLSVGSGKICDALDWARDSEWWQRRERERAVPRAVVR